MDRRDLYRKVGSLLRERRKACALTQEVLSQQMNISRAALANIEAGRQQMLVHQVFAAAIALDCSLMDLLPSPQELESPDVALGAKLPKDLSADQRDQVLRLINSGKRK